MFYSAEILTRRGPLAKVWLAATVGKEKINKSFALNAPIEKICGDIIEPGAPLALRLSAQLMVGVCRVYIKKCAIVLSDVTDLLSTIQGFDPGPTPIDLPRSNATAKFDAITLVEPEVARGALNVDMSLFIQGNVDTQLLLPEVLDSSDLQIHLTPDRSFQADIMDITLTPQPAGADVGISTSLIRPENLLTGLNVDSLGAEHDQLTDDLFLASAATLDDGIVANRMSLFDQPLGPGQAREPPSSADQKRAAQQSGMVRQTQQVEQGAESTHESPLSSTRRKRRRSSDARMDDNIVLGSAYRRQLQDHPESLMGRPTV
eukprot:Plantae.Rhodophyta-Purpureofilum_apyrenoidigerum.ctg39853.p1 GENE.Plantae.Rhodophyta-Purpureofilum_apyrenoidigerum.ctg39853~~Plantae.Rhodophyta-Purpureofilum_apyrenoidigerum.ctg39853.p1  ORF type:complete len:318 (-),score=37.04 Plantae.Rhodophyta-Purpureofilum_apyrenoidigerum.ctg39853:52-1005(-)